MDFCWKSLEINVYWAVTHRMYTQRHLISYSVRINPVKTQVTITKTLDIGDILVSCYIVDLTTESSVELEEDKALMSSKAVNCFYSVLQT